MVAGVSHFKFRSSILRGQPFLYLIILLFRRIMNKVRSKSLLGISSSIPSWRPVKSQEGAVGMICSNANCGQETKKSPQEALVRLEFTVLTWYWSQPHREDQQEWTVLPRRPGTSKSEGSDHRRTEVPRTHYGLPTPGPPQPATVLSRHSGEVAATNADCPRACGVAATEKLQRNILDGDVHSWHGDL